ncbi:pentatricopeptide repeat-containing protein At1g18900-like isoform X3 [Glycine soja]|uniref:Pentatricopeptide repeat-containing protein isoform C n=1 Tax=Glycine soja TaxID=3848 RepID=A0A445L1M9_GLYSO|nr:pentatricopeptide repeat-containing protein At1g18900-like isoform X3 [Glycine soja]RZC17014.1 Pentatricopeptide repeat-containing protein isoform C [Glycine soja]
MQNMLRAKQISSTLSSNARSILLGGSRCNAADGNSCTCPEDETCVSKRQQRKNNEDLLALKPPSLVSKATSQVVGTLVSGNLANGPASHKAGSVGQSGRVQQVQPTSYAPSKSDSATSACVVDGVQDHVAHSSSLNADQFYRAGIAAVNFISDVVSYKLPLSDGMGILNYSKNYMVDPARALPKIRSSSVQQIKKENFTAVHPKPPVPTHPGPSKHTNNHHGAKGKADKSNLAKGFKHVASSGTEKSGAAPNIPVNNHDRRALPQRTRTHSNHFVTNFGSNMQSSNPQMAGPFKESFNKHTRDLNMPAGIVPTKRHFTNSGHVVEVVKDILKQLRWGPATEKTLYNLNFSIDAYQANQILKQLQDHSVAVGFFCWLKRQPGFWHDGHTYTTMVGILGRAREFGAINKLLEQMVKDGCQPNVVTYNRLIHSYGRANYLREALNVFNQMQEMGCEPDRVTYCTLIDIHAKAGFLDVAMSMYERMQEVGLSPDTFTYSVMINCLGKSGNLSAAHRLFCEMVDQGCVPNIVTYNILIALQAKARNYQTALELYRDMQNAGFKPDKVTYSIVMEVLGHCGYLEEAEAVFFEMKQNHWVPDEPVYGLLVDLWGKAGNVEKAWEWYHTMLRAGLLPNVPTCNSLLSAFLRVHRLPDAYNLLQNMVTLGLNPSLQTYTLLLSCCTEAQSPYDMGFCCELMAVSGHPAHAFLQSMPAAGPDGQNVRDHVSKFLDLMHSEDREGKRGLVDAVVDFLHKSGLKEEAGSVWEVAAQKNVYPDAVKEKSTCYWLINLHVMSDGTAVTALSRTLAWFRRQMLASGVGPNRIDIVTGWGRRSRVTGSSLVRQAVQELLHVFSFPFFTENSNSGCFVGCGEPLSQWLVHSYVERMHLL